MSFDHVPGSTPSPLCIVRQRYLNRADPSCAFKQHSLVLGGPAAGSCPFQSPVSFLPEHIMRQTRSSPVCTELSLQQSTGSRQNVHHSRAPRRIMVHSGHGIPRSRQKTHGKNGSKLCWETIEVPRRKKKNAGCRTACVRKRKRRICMYRVACQNPSRAPLCNSGRTCFPGGPRHRNSHLGF